MGTAIVVGWAVGVPVAAYLLTAADPPADTHDILAVAFCAIIWPFVLVVLLCDLLPPWRI
jgi:hypothetical protein